MILTFRHKGLETFFMTGSAVGIQPIHAKRLRELLTALNVAKGLQDGPAIVAATWLERRQGWLSCGDSAGQLAVGVSFCGRWRRATGLP